MTRREEREHLIKLLYLREFHEADELEEQYQLYFDVILPNEGVECKDSAEILERLAKLVSHLPEIDSLIIAKMKDWKISRIGLVEKNILRLCAFDMIYDNVPRGAAINEAVELAKIYCRPEAPGFINGVLAKIVKGLESEDDKQST